MCVYPNLPLPRLTLDCNALRWTRRFSYPLCNTHTYFPEHCHCFPLVFVLPALFGLVSSLDLNRFLPHYLHLLLCRFNWFLCRWMSSTFYRFGMKNLPTLVLWFFSSPAVQHTPLTPYPSLYATWFLFWFIQTPTVLGCYGSALTSSSAGFWVCVFPWFPVLSFLVPASSLLPRFTKVRSFLTDSATATGFQTVLLTYRSPFRFRTYPAHSYPLLCCSSHTGFFTI